MRYLSVEEVLLIHEYQLERYGGATGIRSIELLESAVQRPRTSYGGKEFYPTLFKKAAVLIYTLIKNHPFTDGNKRTALVSGTIFLELNGYKLELEQKEFEDIALNVANDKLNHKNLAVILKKQSNQKP